MSIKQSFRGTHDCVRAFLACVLVTFAQAAWAQDQEGAAGADDPQPAEIDGGEAPENQETPPTEAPAWRTPLDALELHLLPMRQAALEEEADYWLELLEQKTRELSDTEIAILTAEGEARTSLQERAAELRREKAGIAERTEMVLSALEARGGDVESHRKYLAAVSGFEIDVTDTSAAWINFRTWLWADDGGKRVFWNIIKFLVTLLAFWILGIILGSIVRRAVSTFRKTSNLLRDFLAGMTRKTTIIVGAVVAVSMLGVNITPLVAAIGAAGLVIGFALQGTLSNFASGIMILFYRPYDVGNYVNVGGVAGTVEAMTLVSTTLVTPDNQTVIVPNNSVWNNVITNVTGRDKRRVDMTFGSSYDSDIDQAKAVLQEVLSSHPLVLDDPPINIQVNELADSSVNLIARPWVETADYWTVYWELQAQVKQRFDREGIVIPFPQRDVHLYREGVE